MNEHLWIPWTLDTLKCLKCGGWASIYTQKNKHISACHRRVFSVSITGVVIVK